MVPEATSVDLLAIPRLTLIEAAAELLALEEILLDANGRQSCPLTDWPAETAARLLHAVAPDPEFPGSEWYDTRHPVVVEATARAEEIVADWSANLTTPDDRRARAKRIREHQHASAGLMNPDELEALGGRDDGS